MGSNEFVKFCASNAEGMVGREVIFRGANGGMVVEGEGAVFKLVK